MSRRQKPKYSLPRARRKRGSGRLRWLFLAGLLGLLGFGLWFWWPKFSPPPPSPVKTEPKINPVVKSPAKKKSSPVAIFAPLVVSNPPVVIPVLPLPPMVTNPIPKSPPQVPPILSTTGFPRPVKNLFEAQVALANLGISSGSIDGAMGFQTRLALRQFQQSHKLPVTGALDHQTRPYITLEAPPLTTYTVTTNDLARLQPLGKTWLEKSEQSALDYESELELVAEFSHASPGLIKQLNPKVDWANLVAGATLQIPDVQYPESSEKAAFVIIHLSSKYLEAFDAETNLILHCPCSIAARVEKRPVGMLHVIAIAPNPNYTFDPAVFPESPEAQKLGHKLILRSGPNNPVGVAWMSLDRPGYGMHGTPVPEQVGRTESHGCFRLANWDAAYLVKLVWIGLPVEVMP